ncbi:MAG: response regulator [Alphaproteobacteria bacterium]|nr:response regulator [Alphaproteobacteria bacterium]
MAKLLVIDDDPCCSAVLERALAAAGHEVVTQPNGARILAIIAAEPFDAILIDLYMPECDGIETIGLLRRVLPHTPIIGMAGSLGAEDDPCSRAMVLFGAVAVVEKPIDPERLLAALDAALFEAALLAKEERAPQRV